MYVISSMLSILDVYSAFSFFDLICKVCKRHSSLVFSISWYCIVTEIKVCEIPPEWWGHKLGFVSGGLLGAESKRKRACVSENTNRTERTAFHEDDQEKLYHLVQVWILSCHPIFFLEKYNFPLMPDYCYVLVHTMQLNIKIVIIDAQ